MSSPQKSRHVACLFVASLLVLRVACEFDSESKLFKVPELPTLHNWAGNVVFQAKGLRTPHHISQLVDIVKSNDYVRPTPYIPPHKNIEEYKPTHLAVNGYQMPGL